MDALKYLSALRLYGVDVLVIALGVSLITSLLKKTVFKKLSRKVIVILPYALGVVLYFIWRMLVTMSVTPVTHDLLKTAESGFAVGCVATFYYVVYEQFIRGKKESEVNILTPLLEGFIPAESLEECSARLLENRTEKTQEEMHAHVLETLAQFTPDMPAAEREFYAALLVKHLSTLQKE